MGIKMLFDRLTAPWLHPEETKQRKIIDRIRNPVVLKRIVLDERLERMDSYHTEYIKRGVIERIDRQDILREIFEHQPRLHENIRYPIVEKFTDPAYLERLYRDPDEQGMVQFSAARRLAELSDDQQLLFELSLHYCNEAATKLSLEACLAFLDSEQPFEKKASFFKRVSQHLVFDNSYQERFRTGECSQCNSKGPNYSRMEKVSEECIRTHSARPDMMPDSDYGVYRVKCRCTICGIKKEYEETRSRE
jgi:hypothetical protein